METHTGVQSHYEMLANESQVFGRVKKITILEGTLMVNADSDFWVMTNRAGLLHELFSSLLLPTSIKQLQSC